ncbi:hypothetical protein CAXC1_330078 [Candidatus Xenohaliotis californiensis]|uniref:Uncharacterized protein n=1 Tax=Candidatus Xenohaliotis californiensis TaxID=84677 RepID=A0ABM9N8R1_9RICK|nr:hypothetical protein CAXC1_330078 [Candidatus Xenohaliotis californiensis]
MSKIVPEIKSKDANVINVSGDNSTIQYDGHSFQCKLPDFIDCSDAQIIIPINNDSNSIVMAILSCKDKLLFLQVDTVNNALKVQGTAYIGLGYRYYSIDSLLCAPVKDRDGLLCALVLPAGDITDMNYILLKFINFNKLRKGKVIIDSGQLNSRIGYSVGEGKIGAVALDNNISGAMIFFYCRNHMNSLSIFPAYYKIDNNGKIVGGDCQYGSFSSACNASDISDLSIVRVNDRFRILYNCNGTDMPIQQSLPAKCLNSKVGKVGTADDCSWSNGMKRASAKKYSDIFLPSRSTIFTTSSDIYKHKGNVIKFGNNSTELSLDNDASKGFVFLGTFFPLLILFAVCLFIFNKYRSKRVKTDESSMALLPKGINISYDVNNQKDYSDNTTISGEINTDEQKTHDVDDSSSDHHFMMVIKDLEENQAIG